MQMVWKKNKKRSRPLPPRPSNLPFEDENEAQLQSSASSYSQPSHDSDENLALSKQFQAQGDVLAENGKYDEALGKWEAALSITPERAVLHEQKAQIFLEIGKPWKALQAAIRATELQPSWPEAWVTLSRAQLNFGEPELSIQSSKKALELQPNCNDAQVDMEVAMHLIANKQRLRQAGVRVAESRYTVGDRENKPSNLNDDSENETPKSTEILSPESTDETLSIANVNSPKNADES